MFKTKLKNLSIVLITIILTLGFSVSLQSLLAAWTAPTATAPGNNTETPINVGNLGQSKNAGLILNAGAINANGLIVQSGKVGINTVNPNEVLTVNGALSLVESTTTPASSIGYGKIYLKSTPDTFSDSATTKLIIHADVLFSDASESNKTVSVVGGTTISNNSKFGLGSAYFNNGTAPGILSVPDSDDWNFGTEDFTIDMWYYPINTGSWRGLFNQHDISNSNGYLTNGLEQSGNGLRWLIRNSNSDILELSTPGVVNMNQWNHVAAVRNGNSFKIFINGAIQASAVSSASIPDFNSPMIFGARRDDGVNNYYYLNGYLDEIRVSKGVARWTSNFTPSTRPYSLTGNGPVEPYFKDSAGNETSLAGGSSGASSVWGQSGSDIFYNTGKVGIGTTTPSSQLDVVGDICMNINGSRKCLGDIVGTTDIAFGLTPTYVGTVHPVSSYQNPATLTDGNESTGFSVTGSGNQRIIFDFGSPKNIGVIKCVVNLGTGNIPASVQYSDDGLAWNNTNQMNFIAPLGVGGINININNYGAHRYWSIAQSISGYYIQYTTISLYSR